MARLVVIGNSAAGLAAIQAIRSRDRKSAVTLIAAEQHPPYSRILLTYLLSGKMTLDGVPLHGPNWYEEMGVRPLTGRRAISIDTKRRQVITEDAFKGGRSKRVSFDRLLIATGATAERPDVPGMDLPGVFCLRDLDDATAIMRHVEERLSGSRVPQAVFLGGGPVCLQTMTALADRGLKITLLVRSKAIFSQLADAKTASLAEKVLRARGIRVVKGVGVSGIEARGKSSRPASRLVVNISPGRPLSADLIIVGKGTKPNVELARGNNIKTDYGIVVDESMQTSVPGVFAAGDVAQATHCVTGEKVCYGTWTNACEQGRVAALNMVGADAEWAGGLNRNVTTLFGHTLGSVGLIREGEAAKHGNGTVAVRHYSDRRRGVSRRLLFSEGRCLGGVLWNACDDIGVLGSLINSGRDCTGWEDRVARGERLFGDALGGYLARPPIKLARMGKAP